MITMFICTAFTLGGIFVILGLIMELESNLVPELGIGFLMVGVIAYAANLILPML
ncbi:putative membrane protein (plasmid) [Clostridium botulinum]|uniref:Putative membrane protein n=1 Tax=Clostridium botulinum TaxID=1491 RepID=A0A1L7JNE3_CLOBO|nr:putative membrane protein [Clostridium botulinum]